MFLLSSLNKKCHILFYHQFLTIYGYSEGFQRFWKQAKSVWSSVFRYVKVCLFFNCIRYTRHWHKTQMLNNLSSEEINVNALFFLLPAPAHHSFTFDWWFFYELKRKVCRSKSVSGIFHFRFRFVFIKVYTLV